MPEDDKSTNIQLSHIIEAVLLASGGPLSLSQLVSLFEADEGHTSEEVSQALETLGNDIKGRGIELVEVASGFRLQTRKDLTPWVSRLWEQRPQRYSRAMLETLSLIAYRQPVTRGEIEEVRGVSVSSSIIRTLQEREWIRVVGHRDVPGKPALFGTTKAFLDYFELTSLDDLPTLAEIKDMENLEPELDFEPSETNKDADAQNDDSTELTDKTEPESNSPPESESTPEPEPAPEPALVTEAKPQEQTKTSLEKET
jgi:segregation and condensation protein B